MATREVIVELKLGDTQAVARLGQLEIETKAYQRELRALNAEITKNGQATKAQQIAVGELNAKIRANQTVIRELKNDLSGATAAGLRFRDKMAEASRAGLGAFGIQAAGVAGAVTTLVAVLRNAGQTVIAFDQAQGNLAAILGTNKAGIADLTEEAKKYGATTTFTASQVSELQTELAKLGFTQAQVMEATPAILSLAEATGTSLANAATIAAQTLNAFGLSALDTQRIVDVIAQSANLSAFDIDTFSAAMSNAAPAAKAVGIEIEEASAMLSALVDAGIPAEKAGTDLRNIFISLAEKSITMDEAFSQIRGSTDKLTTSVGLFDARAAGSALILADNTDKVNRLEEGYRNAAGAADAMARTQRDTLQGSIKQLQSAWEGLILSIEDGSGAIGGATRFMIQEFTDLLSTIQSLGEADGFNSLLESVTRVTEKLSATGLVMSQVRKLFVDDAAEDARKSIDYTKVATSALEAELAKLKELRQAFLDQGKEEAAREGDLRIALLERFVAMRKAREVTVGLTNANAESTAAEDESSKALDKKTEAVKKLTAAQLAQIDAENAIRGDARENIFAVTPTEQVDVAQAEEPIEEITFQYDELNRLRTEFQDQQIKGIFDYNTQKALIEQEHLQGNLRNYEDYQNALADLDRMRLRNQMQNAQAIAGIFGNLASVYDEASEEYKAFATIQTLINTYMSATAAFNALASIPYVGPVLGGIAAAAAVAAGLANVAKIQGFEEGGYTAKRSKNTEPVGVVHANEWVAPAWQTKHPDYAPTIKWLEQARKRRGAHFNSDGYIGGGIVRGVAMVNMPRGPQTGSGTIAQADLSRALLNMPPPVVSVSEIRDVSNRVSVVERMSRA